MQTTITSGIHFLEFKRVLALDNPHAETPAPVNWRNHPGPYLLQFRGNAEYVAYGITLALETVNTHSESDIECVIELLRLAAEKTGNIARVAEGHFFSYGPLLIPTNAYGLRVLKYIKQHAKELSTSCGLDWVHRNSCEGSSARTIFDAPPFDSNLALWEFRNLTQKASPGMIFGFTPKPILKDGIPKGETPAALPTNIETLVGQVVTNAEDFRNDCSMCFEGAASFLRHFDVSHSCEGQSCEECGSDSGESESIDWAEDFTITEDMAAEIENQGFLTKALEYFDIPEGSPDWETLLEDNTDCEILVMLAPAAGHACYDPLHWVFEPNLEAIETLAELDFAGQCRALPLLAKVCAQYLAEHKLPPVPGRLIAIEFSALADRQRHRSALDWDPSENKLTHRLNPSTRLEWNTMNTEPPALVISGARFPLEWQENRLCVVLNSWDMGTLPNTMLSIFQGSAGL